MKLEDGKHRPKEHTATFLECRAAQEDSDGVCRIRCQPRVIIGIPASIALQF
jgi:hypothetical protein